MRILMTGGAGFIGSNVVDAYVEAGHQVIVVDDLSSGSRANRNPAARCYNVDVRSDEIDHIVETEHPDVVNHHAAQVSVRRSVEAPLTDASVHILGSVRVLEAAHKHGVRRVIFASTGGAIYGEIERGLGDEQHPCRPLSPYAVAKLSVEHYLEYYRATYGLETVVLRYANVYGPRQDPHGEAGVVAIFIQQILAGIAPTIFGDGEQTRDFVYVDDVVRANLAALDVAVGGDRSSVFNIATGREASVNEVWDTLAAIAAPTVTPHHEPPRPGDLRRSVLDPARAKRDLGWFPTVDLAEGLARTWEWFLARETAERQAA
jgi:UDP-glucose 4-epimerase